ncbi:MAG: hypothetical protein MJ065_00415 [Oscillospiraceae bacterium]|nr:hypothetical protein [Oscillospiraceae bacterium]
MGKKRSARQERRSAQRAEKRSAAPRRSLEDRLEEKGSRPYTLKDCMRFGRIANILFVVFIVVCLVYYYSFSKRGSYFIPFEVIAYTIEATAFALFTLSVVWMDSLVRARGLMKVAMIVYILTEIILMLLEFGLLQFIPYNGLKLSVIIVHVLFSAAVSFSLLMLEPQNKRVQRIVGITTIIILAGMLPGIVGYRVYASILINAFAYIFFFTAAERLLDLEEISVDCYGDQAKVTEFDSTMFANVPTMVEIPKAEKKKRSLREKARRLAEDLSSEEISVLTDKEEKFEYEFGVDDDDEYEDDAEPETDDDGEEENMA